MDYGMGFMNYGGYGGMGYGGMGYGGYVTCGTTTH